MTLVRGPELTAAEVKKVQISVLDRFIEVCEQNELRWFLYYGSLLGAIRHRGYIPWDDDIDIAMPRKDYTKIAEIDWGDRGLELISPSGMSSPYPHAKLADRTTIQLELADGMLDNIGVFVDIFPIDSVPKNFLVRELQQLVIYCLMAIRTLKVVSLSPGRVAWKNVILHAGKRLFGWLPVELLTRCADAIASDDTVHKSGIGCRVGPYGRRELLPQALLGKDVEIEFEGRSVPIPAAYHEVLSRLYGDHMSIPPADKRVTHHASRFFWRGAVDEQWASPGKSAAGTAGNRRTKPAG